MENGIKIQTSRLFETVLGIGFHAGLQFIPYCGYQVIPTVIF